MYVAAGLKDHQPAQSLLLDRMSDRRRIGLTVNGQAYEREIETRLTLADLLRHELGLTGTHLGCEHGVCGACTVLVDGQSARACLMLAVQAPGRAVTTAPWWRIPCRRQPCWSPDPRPAAG